MEIGLEPFAVLVAAVLVGAAIQGAIGFGMNLVSVPVFAIVAPELLPVAVIVLGASISVSMFRHERSAVDRAGLAWVIGGRVPGSALGAWFVAVASTSDLRVAVALFVMAIAVVSAVAPAIPFSPATQLLAGVVSGVSGTTAGIGGPPIALLYQRHRGPTMRSTLAATFFAGTIISLTVLGVSGSIELHAVVVGAALTPAVVVGSILGRGLHDVLERGWLRPAVLVFSIASSAWVLVDALV